MRTLRQIPLQKKASLAMFAVSFCLMAVAFGAMLFFQMIDMRSSFEDNLGAFARIAAASSAHAVANNDREAAARDLETLRSIEYFHRAWIDVPGNEVFAFVDAKRAQPDVEGSTYVQVSAPIVSNGEMVGTMWIAGDYEVARAELIAFFVRLAFGVLVVCILLGWMLARRAQRFVLRPVIDLANTAERISRERDLSLRVSRTADDEIGLLTERFNEMLSQVESQDRQLKRARSELESKVVALEFEISERRRVEAGLAEVTQREERRLANDLHDGLGQLLTGIAFKAHLLRTLLTETDSMNAKLATEVVELANESIKQARDIAHGVAPVDLAGAGLSQALIQLGAQIERLMGSTCVITVPDEITGMPLRTSIEIYRICQEAVHNAARHGRATRIEIILGERNSVWRLEIRDNGTGLPPPEKRKDGLGLRLMTHRAETVGGTIAFLANTPTGLIVRCAVPAAGAQHVIPAEGTVAGH